MTLALGAGILVGCGSDEQEVPDTPTCRALVSLAEIGARTDEALAGEWSDAQVALARGIDDNEPVYRALMESDDPAVAGAAEDLLAFDAAVVESGAIEAASLDEFAAVVASLPGSAEAGAADEVLRTTARERCVEGDG